MPSKVFYRPRNGWVGDVIPVERNGEFWLFYLYDSRDGSGVGMTWNLVKTTDFVHFDDLGVALATGGAADADHNAYTGSVVFDGDIAHLFYTGQNPKRTGADDVTPLQLVMRASSRDGLRTWVKDSEFVLGASAGYETGDWRDPFVFRASPDAEWRMLVTARHDSGPERRRGVIAQFVSRDLVDWTPIDPFWDPRRYIAHECPDVFQWGDWWYLVYSEFSERFSTRYRIAPSPDGPWRVPEFDSVDGRAFYASKSVQREGRRFFTGWIATRAEGSDDGAWQWAGDMSVLEAHQGPSGDLCFSLPQELLDSFTEVAPLQLVSADAPGTTSAQGGTLRMDCPDGYSAATSSSQAGAQFLARFTVDIDADTTEVGVLLRSSADGDQAYCLRLEPRRGRMVFDRWPRRRLGPAQWEVSGDVPFAVELERPCRIEPGVHHIELLVEDTALVAVLDKQTVLSARMYHQAPSHLGVFVGEGAATFSEISLATRP